MHKVRSKSIVIEALFTKTEMSNQWNIFLQNIPLTMNTLSIFFRNVNIVNLYEYTYIYIYIYIYTLKWIGPQGDLF